ncbi:hypothetical protein C8F01DRAFT_245205 [Mycena amicta]|nr:hypothetical protein C8F01DRAFT_245205 [Mycena amicta]
MRSLACLPLSTMLAQPSRPVQSSPASRARRRAVCIFPSRPLPPARDSAKSTLLPYYSEQQAYSISPPVVVPQHPRPPGPLPLPPMYSQDNASSAGSTPQATYAETDSDVSSVYDLDFPTPPGIPLVASPAIRRMQSSPLFTSEETDAVREFLRRRWAKSTLPPQVTSAQDQLSDFSYNAESPDCNAFDQLAQAGEALLHAPSNVGPLCPRRQVLRRATSMAAPSSPALHCDSAPPLPHSRSLRFQDAPPPSLATAGRQKPRHRPNLSMPVTGTGLGLPANALGPSFTHRSARSQPINNFQPEPVTNPRSFIDLDPEEQRRKAVRSVPRERVKRLLSRAKSTLIEWSKGFAGKKEAH